MRTKTYKEWTVDELCDFSFNELCALYANADATRRREGGSKGSRAKLFTLIKRRVNAELKRRRK